MAALELAYERIISTVQSCGWDYESDSYYCDLREDVVEEENWVEAVIHDRLTPSPRDQMNTILSVLSLVRL